MSDPSTKLNYLRQYCTGTAKEVIADCVINPNKQKGYDTALELLEQQFGKPYDVARSYIESLKGTSYIKMDAKSLTKFANDMSRCEMTLSQLGYTAEINSTSTMKSIVNRFPFHMNTKWTEYATGIIKRTKKEATFKDLVPGFV